MDEWPPVKCPRFEGESLDAYRRRADKIVEIVSNFRQGVYHGDQAERMEALLVELRTPALEHSA
ncbi:hypothetical protein [Devosia sp. A449]